MTRAYEVPHSHVQQVVEHIPALERVTWGCHRVAMKKPDPRPSSAAGGSLLALAIVAGAAIGVAMGQPTLGALAGLGIGVLLVVLIWVAGRRSPGRADRRGESREKGPSGHQD
jgi:hypothetical protein